MSALSREHRRLLENTIAQARTTAEEGARKVLAGQYAVGHHEPWPRMSAEDRELRNQLRAHGRQLGDRRDARRETQEIDHLAQACAYEHWHRMLFSRFLAENDLLIDAQYGVAMTLDEVRELAREQRRDWMDVASELAQRMLLAVFRPDDPVLKVQLPPETRQQLEEKLTALPKEIFQADDSLGWVYQFWQRDEKDRVNRSEVKIGADEIAAVTQLFTEDYMVLFLLENTLGAWWTAKRGAEGKDPALPGYEWTYLRLNDDGSPGAGSFDGWPRAARDLRVLDPCMGSGHFLVFALPILARMRMEEEGLSPKEALSTVLKENLFGLEIDARCSQIAAFNLALAAWRLVGEHFTLPELNLACSGLGIHASETDWVMLAGNDYVADQWMRRLYSLFKDAPILGSLIDPTRYLEKGQEAGLEHVLPLIEEALQREGSDEVRELAIAARGVVAALRILADRFTLVATNVPYLGRGKQNQILARYCAEFHSDTKADLATCFLDRCVEFGCSAGTAAVVTPQDWHFKSRYRSARRRYLRTYGWNCVVQLGKNAFQDMNWWAANTALIVLSTKRPVSSHHFVGLSTERVKQQLQKAALLQEGALAALLQSDQLNNPDSRIVLQELGKATLLSIWAESRYGLRTGDLGRLALYFWELPQISELWAPFQGTVRESKLYGGRETVLRWHGGAGGPLQELADLGIASIQGSDAWGKTGVAVSLMGHLPVTIYTGETFDNGTGVLWPKDDTTLLALAAFCRSPVFASEVRKIDQAIKVTNQTLLKIPFDKSYWQEVAKQEFPLGLPRPRSNDPTQWLFNGHPKGSDYPLQVAVARLVGYSWPRQTGFAFPDCPALCRDELEQHADPDGIVPLDAIAGEASAGDRLRRLLADAFGGQWSAAKLQEFLCDFESLEMWLRDRFFESHCQIFHDYAFVWHIWDGRKDGFHVLLNYHRLAAPNGEGRKTLEKLVYTYLGRWIERQNDEVRAGKEGADARLTAATHLKTELERILEGEKPYDIFVRWKPLHEQPIGWRPDINDGVRVNIRPWLTAKVHQPSRRDGCILRVTPRISYGKDRGKEPHRAKEDFPWFWSWDERVEDFLGGDTFDGARWNDLHYSLKTKKKVRERKQAAEATKA